MKEWLWQLGYSRWRAAPPAPLEGYTVLINIPGDLPLFLDIAVEVLRQQDPTHFVEALVIPDKITPEIREGYAKAVKRWPEGRLRFVVLPAVDRMITGFLNNPSHNHWLQIIRGIEASRTTHALIHDADLFLIDPQFLRKLYDKCEREKLACVGISPVWDKWFHQQGLTALAATWELMVDNAWFRSFKPWEHHGHRGECCGQSHIFDTTLLPQTKTPPERIARLENLPFVHFNYVISTYRSFQKAQGPFEDSYYRLLLIRLLHDAYGSSHCKVPPFEILLKGCEDFTLPVIYKDATHFPEFRRKMQELMDSKLLSAPQVEMLQTRLNKIEEAMMGSLNQVEQDESDESDRMKVDRRLDG